jgi:hypothetical protein
MKSLTLTTLTTPKVRESIVGHTFGLQGHTVVTESKEEKKVSLPEEEAVIVCSIPKLLLPFISSTSKSGGAKEWMIPIPYAANLSTSGSGFISAAVLPVSATAVSSFTSLAALFDEFFIEAMEIHYQPQTRYQVLPSTTTSEHNGTPLGIASQYLDVVAYTNINQMPANPTFKFAHSSSPFRYVWKNNVKRSSAVSTEPDATHPSLSWVRTNATPAQYYGGAVNIIGSATSAMHASTVVGVVAVRYVAWFRAKS